MALMRQADEETETLTPGRRRLDKWLFFARFARTRALAARLVSGNAVRVDGRRVNTPGYQLKTGDVLTLGLPHMTCVVRVAALGERRGPAPEARMLYEMVSEG
jgi:ribosome-associated heat shock protein Hsp15